MSSSCARPSPRVAIARRRPIGYAILWRRREKILRAYFSELPPLDWFRVEHGALCWDDLWIVAGLDGDGTAQYSADDVALPRGAPRCVAVPGGGYRIVSLRVRRGGERHFSRPVRVHLIDRRIVGVQR